MFREVSEHDRYTQMKPDQMLKDRSRQITDRNRREALGEIFDVLLLSTEFDEGTAGSPVSEGTELRTLTATTSAASDLTSSTIRQLDTSTVRASVLKSSPLAAAVQITLDLVKPEMLTKEEFIQLIEEHMRLGTFPPISTFLTSCSQRDDELPMSSQDKCLSEMREKPTIPSKSEILASRRKSGLDEQIERRLHGCKDTRVMLMSFIIALCD